MSDVESSMPDNLSVKQSKSNEYSSLLNHINESVTNTNVPEKKEKSKPKASKIKNKRENTKVKKRRQRTTIVAPPSEEHLPVLADNNNDGIDIDNSEIWTAEETGDEMLDFDGGTVEFNVQISRFVALAVATLVVEMERKQPKFARELEEKQRLSRTEQLLNDSKRSLPRSCSQQTSKEVLICSKHDSNLNPVKDEKSKSLSYRRKRSGSSKEILKQDIATNTTANDNEKHRSSLPRGNPSSKEIMKDASSNTVKIDKPKKLRSKSQQSRKEVAKDNSKQEDIESSATKEETSKKSKSRSKQSSKEVSKDNSKQGINSSTVKEEASKKSKSRSKQSCKEVSKDNSNQDIGSSIITGEYFIKSTSGSKMSTKQVSKDTSKEDIDSSTVKEEKSKKATSKTRRSSKEVLKVSSNQDQHNSSSTKDDKSKKFKSRSKPSRKEISKDSSKQDIDSTGTTKEENSKKPTSKTKQGSKEVLKVSSSQDQDVINSNAVVVAKEEKPRKSKSKNNKQFSKEIVKVSSSQVRDINSNITTTNDQSKKSKSKKLKSNVKNTNVSTNEVREEAAEALDFDEKKVNEPVEKPRRFVKKTRNKAISPINEQVERENETAVSSVVSKPEVETFLVEATGQSENIVVFSSKHKSKKSDKNKNSTLEMPAPPRIPFETENKVLEPEPDIKDVAKKKSTDELSSTPTTVALLPPTASEVSISTTGSCHAVTYPPVPTIGANMGDQLELVKYLVQVQNYINHLGYHHHHLGEPKIYINSRHSMKMQMVVAREIIQAGLPIKSLHAAVLAVHFTNSLEAVERFPIYFRSHVSSKEYKHIVLGIFVQGNYGALGISRDSGLQDKPASYAKLSDLIFEFAKCYGHSGHILNEVHFGGIMTHDPVSSERLFTKNHVVSIVGCLHSEIEKNIEKFAKLLRNKMGIACRKVKQKRLRDLKRLSKISSDFNKSSRTGLLDYVNVKGSETSSCANIRLRVLNMNMSVNLLDKVPIRVTKCPIKRK